MGTVYLARQTDLGRLVALKELAALGVADPALADRFVRESRLAGSLSHPNIVHVYDYFEFEGAPYIAMEYLPRGSLRPFVRGLSVAQVAGVLEGLLAGLGHAAGRGIVHRDLKPENVLVTGEGAVKIADFGIAKALDEVGAGTLRTATGATIGTPAYMAPEQAMAGDLGPATDLYSLGVMAYEMLGDQLPFDASTPPMALLMRHVNEPVAPLRDVAPDVDPRLAAWVERLLAKEPAQRPATPAAAWDELEEIVLDLCGPRWRRDAPLAGDAPPPAGAAPDTGAPTRGPRTPPTMVAPPPSTPQPPPAARDRRRPWPLLLGGAAVLAAAGVALALVLSSGDAKHGAGTTPTVTGTRVAVGFRPTLTKAITQLVGDNESMSSRLQGLKPGSPSVSALARTDLAIAQTDATRSLLVDLQPRTAGDRRLEASVRSALAFEKRFLVAVRTTLRRKASAALLASLGGLSAHLIAHLTALDGIVPDASDSIQGTHKLKAWAAGPSPGGGATGQGTSSASTPPPSSGSSGGAPTAALVLHLPPDASAASADGNPVVVSFAVSASEGSASVPASCSPGSGNAFPVGATTVTCTADDGRGQTKTGSFTVTVTGPATPPAGSTTTNP